jgi:hypothetical protein
VLTYRYTTRSHMLSYRSPTVRTGYIPSPIHYSPKTTTPNMAKTARQEHSKTRRRLALHDSILSQRSYYNWGDARQSSLHRHMPCYFSPSFANRRRHRKLAARMDSVAQALLLALPCSANSRTFTGFALFSAGISTGKCRRPS